MDAENSSETNSKSGGKPHRFQVGNDMHKRRKKLRGGGKGAHRPRLLRDMTFVYESPKEKDLTEGHRVCRELLEKDPDKFLSRLTALEKAWMQSRAKVKEDAEDDGEDDLPPFEEEPFVQLLTRFIEEGKARRAEQQLRKRVGELERNQGAPSDGRA